MDIKRQLVKKPDRGSFLLDHNNECTSMKEKYLKCLKENNNDHICCRDHSKEYFICRMDNNLLERQSLNDLGFIENDEKNESRIKNFKDVYSYNVYNENMERISRNTHDNIKSNNLLLNENNMLSKLNEHDHIKFVDINDKNDSNDFILLDIINKENANKKINTCNLKNSEINEEKKIAIRRKEAEGYLAGKEYIKTLLEKKKKKTFSFLNEIFKSNNA
ncbi:cytochrome c oxidase assembly protein COX19, putative [Plasmodium gaboni]|uniref:Cytochrome c oxidase assembly protein COX19, putative n=1 Tax=Plasmodium gaboni TaxID=647221 RepID=A0ABY1UPQ0_9APIC|nr:cytochrome c oxidase assembly protein COX19, putative [Plasmodium gaboni]